MLTHRTPKPEGSTWTDDQWEAIVTGGQNVLVAAAAGSGKTAVLVERIIRKISSHTDVDRLLVATFTKAAAAEMKDRIRLALEKELERKPDSEHLRRQLALMGRASITTLHSFCLDVIRKYYPLIGLDPGFRIANETESELMRLDVLDELFEQKYGDESGDGGAFFMLADRYGGERGDEPLYQLVQGLYDFAQSHPWPEHWLRETASAYEVESIEELEQSEWVATLRADILLALEGAVSQLQAALELTRQPAGPAPYADALEEDLRLVLGLLETVKTTSWRHWGEPFRSAEFGKLKAMRGDDYDKELQAQAKELRENAKKLVSGLADELFGREADQFLEELRELAPLMRALSELVISFGERYEEAKRAKGLLDFGDLEHYCLRILRDASSTPDRLVPSVAALDYQQLFDEILLDEYQDTNMVQEAIVSLIERSGTGNRFMVGDVKQSIYRFRLAEPNLFLAKYKAYRTADERAGGEPTSSAGQRIDLARNFRSRREVVDGVNGVFRAIMRENVAEMDYDTRAELVCGAAYPEPLRAGSCNVQFAVLDRGTGGEEEELEASSDAEDGSEEENRSAAAAGLAELKVAQLEARWIAAQIRELADSGYQVYDGRKKAYRPFQWRDAVILLRATQQWSPILIEELQQQGISAYAELSTGYFEATEVETMLSLLRVIDNPNQDIPLAATLRSPLFGMTAEELARIRILSPKAPYYDAVLHAAGADGFSAEARLKLAAFLNRLDRWRAEARQGSLAELLWSIYRETGYYDFVGGLPGGAQRQANLRALHDRARQYEATSFRGLFRFLRFIERMRESGGDLGTAGALGEGEDVVRIMSIHKSKGLEFPVVFIAGLGKLFNQQDMRSSFLKHKALGFGPRYVDPELRISYPTLPFLAIRRKLRMETLAEEMRILYVALTRPKEKMFLVGTVADAAKAMTRWAQALNASGELSDYRIASARSFIDWLGPLAVNQLALAGTAGAEDAAEVANRTDGDPQVWEAQVMPVALFVAEAAAALEDSADDLPENAMNERLQAVTTLALIDGIPESPEIRSRLEWQYPYRAAEGVPAKTSVTEMKRLHAEAPEDAAVWEAAQERNDEEDDSPSGPSGKSGSGSGGGGSYTLRLRRPSFMEEKSLTAAERGSVHHLLMQHVPLTPPVNLERIEETLAGMVNRKLLTAKQAEAIDPASILSFYDSEIGARLLRADWVKREVPFSCMFPANRVYAKGDRELEDEPILIQGVIDCLFQDKQGVVLLDYKTDRVYMKDWEKAAERHRFQLELYAEAIEATLARKVDELYLYFFDGAQFIKL
ncbi:helicase-exonuclease AddAB subunit AddA [Paenibacillus nanensis]|uniref:ATP-dependent helicase/nuclease subunit A n=1 Tax=Paenibacillus nanensis TaxID=393251 RepID=A0A3A1V042_9BACL|nr:helicase-exonuclease AddAB subunit AddA [Paenibacillus nanensis]RIX54118.1 helicase-exonuclease AddAB subunit AddA [Paenibacillus nanensis]